MARSEIEGRYEIHFDGDVGGEAPHVYIYSTAMGDIAEVFEEPVTDDPRWQEGENGVWSWDVEWKLGPRSIAQRIVDLLNEHGMGE